jgi:serine/threonine-protein kinase RsbW
VKVAFSLLLPREASTVSMVRRLCRDALTLLGVKRGCISDIEIAVSEACTNVLKHVAGTGDAYEVTVEVESGRCEISVVDTGLGFDHTIYGVDGGSLEAEGGRGIYLMEAMVDRLEFRSVPESGTIVHLEKTLDFHDDSLLEKLGLQPTA